MKINIKLLYYFNSASSSVLYKTTLIKTFLSDIKLKNLSYVR